jgi:hypothetical protein
MGFWDRLFTMGGSRPLSRLRSIAPPTKNQYTILEMESLTEENKTGTSDYDRGRPNREPQQRLFAVRSLDHTDNGQHAADDPDSGFDTDSTGTIAHYP